MRMGPPTPSRSPALLIPFRGAPIRDFMAPPGFVFALEPIARAAGRLTLHLRPNGVEVTSADPNVLLAFVGLLVEAQAHAPADSSLLLLAPPDVAEG
jgi:hypothetical protein